MHQLLLAFVMVLGRKLLHSLYLFFICYKFFIYCDTSANSLCCLEVLVFEKCMTWTRHLFTANAVELRLLLVFWINQQLCQQATFSVLLLWLLQLQQMLKLGRDDITVLTNPCLYVAVLYYSSHKGGVKNIIKENVSCNSAVHPTFCTYGCC